MGDDSDDGSFEAKGMSMGQRRSSTENSSNLYKSGLLLKSVQYWRGMNS